MQKQISSCWTCNWSRRFASNCLSNILLKYFFQPALVSCINVWLCLDPQTRSEQKKWSMNTWAENNYTQFFWFPSFAHGCCANQNDVLLLSSRDFSVLNSVLTAALTPVWGVKTSLNRAGTPRNKNKSVSAGNVTHIIFSSFCHRNVLGPSGDFAAGKKIDEVLFAVKKIAFFRACSLFTVRRFLVLFCSPWQRSF